MLERQQKLLIAALQKLHENTKTGDDSLLISPAPSPDGSRSVNQILSQIGIPTLKEDSLNESKEYSADDGHRATAVQQATWPPSGALLCDDIQTHQLVRGSDDTDNFGMVWSDGDALLHWDMFDQQKTSAASTAVTCSNDFEALPLLPGRYGLDTCSSNSWQPMNFMTDSYVCPSLVFGLDRPLGLENTIDRGHSSISQNFAG